MKSNPLLLGAIAVVTAFAQPPATTARQLENSGDIRGAEQRFQASIASSKNLDRAKALAQAGIFYQDIGKFAEAESCFRKSLRIWSERAGHDDVAVAPLIANLAWLYLEAGRLQDLKALNLPVWVARVTAAEPNSTALSPLLQSLAGLYSLENRFPDAEATFYRAFDYLPNNGDHSVEMAMALNNFGLVCMRGGRYDQALTYFLDASILTDEFFRPTDLQTAIVKGNLAGAYMRTGQYGEGQRLFEEATAILEQRCGPNCLRTAETLSQYSQALRYANRHDAAGQMEARARKIRQQAGSDTLVSGSIDVNDLRKQGPKH